MFTVRKKRALPNFYVRPLVDNHPRLLVTNRLKLTTKRTSSLWISTSFLPYLTLVSILISTVATATTIDPITTGRTRLSKETPPQRHMRRLYDYLFADYEKELRPVINDSQPLTVTVQFWLKQILKIDEGDQTIKIYLWLELYWTDELLTWNPADFGGLDQIHVPTHKLWKPDLVIYNNAQMNVEQNELETNAIVNSRGEVILFRAMISSITCGLSLASFPFDQQVCFLTFASWSMDGSKLLLMPSNNSDSLQLYIKNSEWLLTDFAVKMYEKRYDCCLYSFPDITYFMVLKRSPAYYISTLIVPSAAITVVTIVGFFVPHSSTGENTEKVSLGVNALLSMSIIMMMVSGEVPATSEVIPLIGKFYIGLIFLIFTAAFTTTLTLAFQMRGNSGVAMSPRMKYILFEIIAQSPLGAWVFAVQIGQKHRYANRAKGGPKNKENNTYIFDNVCVSPPETTEFDGILSNNINSTPPISNANGIKVKLRGSQNNTAADVKRAKIVQMEDITGDLHKNSSVGLVDTQQLLTAVPHYSNSRLNECLNRIEESITRTHQQRNIEYEWEQAARIVDRMLMLFFIALTVLFAFFMLGGSDDDIKLTESVMDSVKR
ncbi:Acr-18 [Aphelenchoides besseyi]|nr:Acr-18 [Aphelenchoides besseyi]KAI6199997.1 Acr-18 [Aphelenchoides besseyi]